MTLELDNIEQIHQAIEVERKFQYINIKGRETTFSKFMISQIKKIYKLTKKETKWAILIEYFEHYEVSSMLARKNMIEKFIKTLKEMKNPPKKKENNKVQENKIETTDVTYLKGVGPKIAYLFNKVGIFTVFDLLHYYPVKYINYSSRVPIKQLNIGENVTIVGKITGVSFFNSKKGLTVFNVTIADNTGSLRLTYFYQKLNRYTTERYKQQFPKGANVMVTGFTKLDTYTNSITLDKAKLEILNDENINYADSEKIVPIYPLSENLNSKVLVKAIKTAYEKYNNQLTDTIPYELRQKRGLMDRKEAIKEVHFPSSNDKKEQARYSLIYEEFFLMQLQLAINRANAKNAKDVKPLKIKKNGLVSKFIKSLPFELTNAQKRAINEILSDLQSEEPMQRLLQGDVGSGKTVVAIILLLASVENGYQAAIMAPTEILARQHFETVSKLLLPLNIRSTILIGSMSKKSKDKAYQDILNGQTDIIIGTHAILQDNLEYSNLGAIVIDEQHRFGVNQRTKLKQKAKIPQMLTMSATPIPRSLSLTLNGDLDLTVIDEMPKGRKPIKTVALSDSQRKQVYTLIRAEVEKGHQAYVVYPLIDESETLSAKAATTMAEKLQNEIFSDLKIGLLHGKMTALQKDEVMKNFNNKKYDILVATTVVEVGIDVKNANVIVIENAERFGLSQLHQLRGRVGRSDIQSYCVLVSNSKSETVKQRMQIMCMTNDGFLIAEKDLQMRGPGEYLGVRQSGLPALSIADLTRDLPILEIARKDAFELIENHREINHEYLKKLISNYSGSEKSVDLIN